MSDPSDSIREEFNSAISELLETTNRAPRCAWKRTKLDQGQVEYITDRQRVIDAVKAIQQIAWQSINCEDKQLAMTIREFALHSLATLAQSMVKNEDRIL